MPIMGVPKEVAVFASKILSKEVTYRFFLDESDRKLHLGIAYEQLLCTGGR